MIIGIAGKKNAGKDTVADYIIDEVIKNDVFFKKVRFADKLKEMVCLLLGCTKEQLEDREFKEKELGKEWWYWRLKVPNYNLDRNEKITLKMMFNTETEAWEYNDKILSYNREVCETVLIKPTPRLLLQLLGTECGRNIIHPNIWVNATFADYQPNGAPYNSLGDVFDDLKLCPSETKMPNWVISDVRFPNEAKAIKDRNGILIRVERFCYDSPEDFLVCNPNPELRKIGVQDYNINKTLSLEEITDIAKVHGYISLSEQHESETALDTYEQFDHIITNNGTIEDLHKKVEKILLSI